ncbi:MAG: hypothetical protein EB054_03490, partial [Actinobacteria bacterium]|nr:hypothetical protein [Actinomycetota bacterium]
MLQTTTTLDPTISISRRHSVSFAQFSPIHRLILIALFYILAMRCAFAVLLILVSGTSALAEECRDQMCIDVSTDNNQEVLITVTKNAQSSTTTSSVSPRPKPKPSPSVWIPWLPRAKATPVARPRRTTTAKPRPTPRITAQTISASAMMDQVRSAIPNGVISHQPISGILVREPIYFQTTVPRRFSATIIVLEVPIQIEMNARYQWNFGDRSTLVTTDSGGPYPISTIRHSYARAGNYLVALEILWSGNWRSGPLAAPIRGEIRQVLSRAITVDSARA